MTHTHPKRLAGIDRDLIARFDVPTPRYTSYPTIPMWRTDFGAREYENALSVAGAAAPDKPLSLYVHIPFCQEMCTYCGCNVVVSRDPARAERYLDALAHEIRLVARQLGKRRSVSRLHYGGGTPTFLSEQQLLRLWGALTSEFEILANAELAVEIDPVVTRREQIALLRGLGFKRLSMGVQDFDTEVQNAVHRIQTVAETKAILDYARELGFSSVNFDLIYGLPKQTPATWLTTLKTLTDLAPDRVAVFSFAFVPDVRKNQSKLNASDMLTGPAKLELFGLAHDVLTDAGYQSIGMDHFALPKDELSQARQRKQLWRDFQGYTVFRGADTIAFGITGIGSVGDTFVQNTKSLGQYQDNVSHGLLSTERGLVLSADDLARQNIITQLMCNFWVDLGSNGATRYAAELERLKAAEIRPLVEVHGTEITVTPLGQLFVRNVASVFDAYLDGETARPRFSQSV